MRKKFDIIKYTSYFHDGTLFNILTVSDQIAFQMSSAEINVSDIEKGVLLSKDCRIQGVLHFCDIEKIKVSGGRKLEDLFKVFNLGTILDFEIAGKTVELGILWENHPPKVYTTEFTTIEIQANRIWWENIPDLRYPAEGIGIDAP
jgi:hypothetical protein